MSKIISTTDNRYFAVRDSNDPDLAHVWLGTEVKIVKKQWVPRKNARETLVRKVGTIVISPAD